MRAREHTTANTDSVEGPLAYDSREEDYEEHKDKKGSQFQLIVPLWKWTDFDDWNSALRLLCFRLIQGIFLTYNMSHPDEYWQSIEVAYNMVYGGVQLTWEWDDSYKIRSTIYPAYLAVPLYLLKLLGIDNGYMVRICP